MITSLLLLAVAFVVEFTPRLQATIYLKLSCLSKGTLITMVSSLEHVTTYVFGLEPKGISTM